MRSTGADILIVDDEADIRELVSGLLEDEGHAVRVASNAEEALAGIRARKPTLLVLDIWMQGGGMDGLELLDMVKALDADLPVVMISGHGNIETAVSALKRGAYDFIEKPFKSDRLVVVIERALEAASLKRENRRLRAQASVPTGLIGRSAAAQALRARQGVDEIVDQFGDVLAALRQRWDADRHHVQAVEQVLAEAALGDLGLQVARGGGDHADVDLHVLLAADAAEALFDQHAQDSALALARHVADVV